MPTTISCRNEACRFLTKSDTCGLLASRVDEYGKCLSQMPHPEEPPVPHDPPMATQ
jgi:hypothetical protein